MAAGVAALEKQTGKKFGEAPKATAGWDDSRGITVVQRRDQVVSTHFREP
jgi:hypothetical protein